MAMDEEDEEEEQEGKRRNQHHLDEVKCWYSEFGS
jgi:hypothetical protein